MEEQKDRMDPNFKAIIPLCVEELKIKFSKYGNTWLESDDVYYKKRLMNEVEEYIKSMTVSSEQRKLLNIINIAAMAYQTAPVNRSEIRVPIKCPKCGEPLKSHLEEDGYLVCQIIEQ